MSQVDLAEEDARLPSRRRGWLHVVALLLVAYIVMAYLVIPFAWESYAHERPSFDDPDTEIIQTSFAKQE